MDSSKENRDISKASLWNLASGWLCLILLLAYSSQANAGAWVKEPYKFSTYVSFGFYNTNEVFDYKGDKRPTRIQPDRVGVFSPPIPSTYRQYDGTLYLEYGLPADFEIDLNFPFFVVAQQEASVGTYSTSGISDMTTSVKYKWFERDWLLSAIQFDLGIPIGDDTAQATTSGQTTPQFIPLGDGEWDYGFRLIASRGFVKVPVYVSAEMGYRFRNFDRGGNDLPWSTEGGYTFDFHQEWFSNLTFFLNFTGVVATDNLSAQDALVLGSSTAVSGHSPNQEYIEIRPGLFAKIFGPVSLGINPSYVLMGKNTGAGWGLHTTVAWESK